MISIIMKEQLDKCPTNQIVPFFEAANRRKITEELYKPPPQNIHLSTKAIKSLMNGRQAKKIKLPWKLSLGKIYESIVNSIQL